MKPSTTELTLNLQLPNVATVAWAVQGDQLSRQIVATLVDGSAPWNPLTVYNGVVRYKKPDGTIGVYDTDEDGNRAVTWSGNVATIKIVQQALTVPGTVIMQLDFYDSTDARVSTFGWCTNVQPAVVTDTEFLSTDYYNILTLQIAAVLGISNFKYMIANEESTSTATMAHAVGDYFILDNILYITTSAIAVGGTISPGTNCEAAVIGDDLSTVKSDLNQKANKTELTTISRTGATNTGAQIEIGTYFYLDGVLKKAIATIAQNATFTAQNCVTITSGGFNALNKEYIFAGSGTSVSVPSDWESAIVHANIASSVNNFTFSTYNYSGYSSGTKLWGGVPGGTSYCSIIQGPTSFSLDSVMWYGTDRTSDSYIVVWYTRKTV